MPHPIEIIPILMLVVILGIAISNIMNQRERKDSDE
jgi:hypothetical protein